jgi:hypothetical protein
MDAELFVRARRRRILGAELEPLESAARCSDHDAEELSADAR